ncbi:hypothetical protein V502_08332 [Pseudogymnoascus sp. VKM F-4520 (FW-2644)]|nr:hypothetical protein V502_08332 [Pseudogymnoascus sp. VKM F-4520 (FW-2644)]
MRPRGNREDIKDLEDLAQTATSHIDGRFINSFNYTSAPDAEFLGTPLTMPASDTYSQFRFRVELNAPTAMMRQADDIRVKYLNINQAYSMSIVDTAPELAATLYRTSVRISLDDQQRQNPETFWHLWMKGSGAEGLYQRENNLQAVELVQKPFQGLLEKAFFDGFSVIWTLGTNGCAECNIAVRFNFLPTDFGHYIGAECVPVRLYAETEILNTGQNEISYCK